jgi:hypothetical protein
MLAVEQHPVRDITLRHIAKLANERILPTRDPFHHSRNCSAAQGSGAINQQSAIDNQQGFSVTIRE